MMSVCVDSYGYRTVPLTEDEMLARQASSLRAKKQVKAWQSLNPLSAPSGVQPRSQALKPLIRKGIPYQYRPGMWYILSGAAAKCGMHPSGHYQSLAQQHPVAVELQYSLEEDIRGSAPHHAMFQSAEGLAALRRVLLAFFQHSPEARYFRGVVSIAAFVLVVFGLEKEEEAFWVLGALVEGRMVTSPQEQVALAARVEQKVLEALVRSKMPKLYNHLSRMEGGFAPLTTSWFSAAFATTLPAETTVRVWDALMLEGRKVLLRLALALLKTHEVALLSCSREEQMKRVLDMRCSRAFDADALLQLAFKGIGSMPNATIHTLRSAACEDVAQRQEQLHLRLAGVITHVI